MCGGYATRIFTASFLPESVEKYKVVRLGAQM